jgi:hypothetical protein
MKRISRNKQRAQEHRRVSLLDDLAEFEQFQEEILPALRQALKEGKTAEDIYKMASSAAAARSVSIALREQDSTKALAAIRDILDRDQGKAKERMEHEHKYGKLKEEELDALLLSEAAASDTTEEDEEPGLPH